MPTTIEGWYPHNPLGNQECQALNSEYALTPLHASVMHIHWTTAEAAALSLTAVHAAITDTGAAQTVSTGFTDPPCPRNIVARSGGTAGDIGAIQITIHGLDFDGNEISEILPIFTANSATTVVGSKIFASVTSVDLPAHDGTGATTSIGFGDKLGIPYKLPRNTFLFTFLNNVIEGTPATVGFSSSALESNYIDLNSALDGTVVDAFFVLSGT